MMAPDSSGSAGARERILSRLREGARRHSHHGPAVAEREAEWLALQAPLGDFAARFTAGQEAVGGKVIQVADWDRLPEAVSPWMREYQVRTAITGTVERLSALRRHLSDTLGIGVRLYSRPVEEQQEELFSTDCGITLALAGIADTGSVVLRPSPEEPRLLSLAPPIHLVILERAKIVGRMLDFLATGTYQESLPTNLVFATGASRTADIEQTLSVGVHGPKVFLVALVG